MSIFNYKWWWTRIGGRKWTYIMRDFYHKFEYIVILGFFTLGYFLRPHFTLREFLIMVIAGSICFLLGHLYWGTTYIENQGVKD